MTRMIERISIFLDGNWKDINQYLFWKACLAELIGTSLLALFGCGSCLGEDWQANDPTAVQISFTFGLCVATVVKCISHVSGGHINPAVTIAMLSTRRVTLIRGLCYVSAQMIGGVVGVVVLKSMTPIRFEGELGQTTVFKAMRPFPDGMAVEGLITFTLVFTVFASTDINRNDRSGSAPLAIGLSVLFCHLFAIKYTGASMNPARTFGPAVVGGIWKDHYIYWVGPILGGIVAAFFYEFIFAQNATPHKFYRFLTRADYQGDDLFVVSNLDKEIKNHNEFSTIENLDD